MAGHGSVPAVEDVGKYLFAKLYRLCRDGGVDELRDSLYFEEKAQECISVLNQRGYTLLHEAVEADQCDVVQVLLQHGVPPDIQGKGKQTPLHLAVSKGYVNCVRALLEGGADIKVRDDLGHDALAKAERSKRRDHVLRLLKSKELVHLVATNNVKGTEKLLLFSNGRLEKRDIEEALLQAVLVGASDTIAPLVMAGARKLDAPLALAKQQEQEKAIAMLLLCKAIILGDCQAIRSLLSEPADTENAPWYMPVVHKLLSQGTIKMYCPIAVSITEGRYEATKELLLRTDLDMRRKTVDWGKLMLTLLHPSWIYSIAPWVVNLKLGNNHLKVLPGELQHSAQLRRLDLSHNLLERVDGHLFSLPNLEQLNLSHNRLVDISENTKWTSSLISLDLSHNQLQTLPPSIQDSCLEILSLGHNKFTTIPKSACRIRTLTTLDLSNMPIASLPQEMAQLEKLVNLNVSGCNISDIPPNMNYRGVRGLFKARTRSSKACNHVKLVVLCSSSQAKVVMYTRLRQTIVPHSSHLSDMEQFQWSHKSIRLKQLFSSQKLHFNTWMVGLPRDYRSIYSCLYTTNALYVIVWDMTKSSDIGQLLKPYINSIHRHVPAANILLIVILPDPLESWLEANSASLNKKVTMLFSDLPYQTLQYHGIAFTSNNLNSKDSPGDIRVKIYDVATSMSTGGAPVVNHQFPENYYQLISVLESEHSSCKAGGKHGIVEEDSLWSLMEQALGSEVPDRTELPVITTFLKETGHLMHFEDPNQRLDHYYFLHPEWIVGTFHKLLQTLHHHHTNKPVVSLAKLSSLLKCGNYTPAVIRLMVRFAIILPISSSEYLTPSLLPTNAPPLAMRQCGCFRRQLMPKGKAIPDDFWYYLITHILFQLPRILSEEPYCGPHSPSSSSLTTAPEKAAVSPEKDDSPKENAAGSSPVNPPPQTLNDSLELTTGGASLPSASKPRPRALLGRKEELMEMIPKRSQLHSPDSAAHGLDRAPGSPARSPTNNPVSDPVEIEPGLLVWQNGVLLQRKDVQFGVYSQTSELSMDERGIEICASDGEQGCRVMAKVCWSVEKLLEQRFPRFFSSDVQLVNQGLTQIILCPRCVQERKHSSTSVTNFVIETCFVSIKDEGLPTHNCHHHADPIPLSDLIPEYLMVDLPLNLHLLKTQYQVYEGPPIHRESSFVLCEASFNEQPVLAKMLVSSEYRSLTIPLSALRQEMEMLTSLRHPNIIRTFGFSLHPQCILLERAPMGTLLQKLMDNEQKISRLARFSIAHQVASALQYLHRQGIIYRTMKADSILTWSLEFEDDISVKLANFDRAEYISPSGLMGRAEFSSYPAPEMARYSFREEYTEKVDIYSFAILLYELIARWQPFASERVAITHRPKLTGLVTYGFNTLTKLMEKCWEEDPALRPSSSSLVQLISQPSFQCHFSSQMLRDCVSVRGCCFVPSLRQVWVYGEYNVTCECDAGDAGSEIEGTQVFIVNADNLTVQGSLELKERANAICTVDCKVWVGMLEACIHVYDSTTFHFTDRIHLLDSVTVITTNDTYAFVGLANGVLTYYVKLQFPKECTNLSIGNKAIICMVPVEDSLWISCGHEMVVLAAEEEVAILKRWEACQSKDQVCALVLSGDKSVVWSAVRGSLTITSWDVCSYNQISIVDLSPTLRVVCCDLNVDPTHLRLHSIASSQDTLWIGLQNGVIVVLSDTRKPEVISWFKAHGSATRCLLEVPCNKNSSQMETPVVISGGYGEQSSLCAHCSNDSGVVMSWQSLTSDQFKILGRRREMTHS